MILQLLTRSRRLLSAAVDSTKSIGDMPALRRNQLSRSRPTPNASRSSGERGLGGEALLSEKQPPSPQNLPHVIFPEGARGRGPFLKKGPLPRNIYILTCC